MRKNTIKILSVIMAAILLVFNAATVFAAQPTTEANERELRNAALAKKAAMEGMVLFENNGVLPIAQKGNVALFGVGSYDTVKGGTGSGDVNNRYTINVRTGFESNGYNITTNDTYYNAMKTNCDNAGTSGGMWGGKDYASYEVALTAETVQPKAATDTAVYVVARNSGEGSDRSATKGDFYLNDIETANIKLIGETYKNVVVVLNTGGILDTEFFKQINASTNDPASNDAIDALFLMSQAGQESGYALVDVLNGKESPSGKLTDTWASSYDLYPASETFGANDGDSLQEDYVEGVYVGYRYFDSFAGDLPDNAVNYEFGYGLSYTNFDINVKNVSADMDQVTVAVDVTNTGSAYSGKEVVEVYFSAPTGAGKLDKPYQELAAFGKTDKLAPGETQSMTLTYKTTEMSSYNEDSASYVMDGGDYIIRVGNSSRNTKVAAVINLPETTVTEKLSNQADDQKNDDEWVSDASKYYSYDNEAREIASAKKLTLNTAGFAAPDNASDYAQDVSVDDSNFYYSVDGDLISSVNVYLNSAQTDWEGTGAAYQPKTGENVVNTAPAPAGTTLYDVYKGNVSMEAFVASLSVEQLANIVEGASLGGSTLSAPGSAGYSTSAYENLGIAQMSLADGPAGIRITREISGGGYQYCTAWPIATMLAMTWNVDLMNEVGQAIGEEMVEYGATIWLAPAFNLHRDPLCGRNFEYYSEDPYLAGMFAIAVTKGVQSNPGVGVCVKHYASNNQEVNRDSENNTINERALREMYLKSFEMCVKGAQPMSFMSSYNKCNGTYVAGDYDHMFDILRGEWDFKGFAMTDWGGVRAGVINCMYAGNDMITPGNAPQEVINATLEVSPTFDYNGLPVYSVMSWFGMDNFTWSMNSFVPDANGTVTFSKTVDETTDLNKENLSGSTVFDMATWQMTVTPVPAYVTVNNAYNHVAELLSGSGLTASQKAGITLSDVQKNGADEVISYTINYKGYYGNYMRLGDLQRSAINILNVVQQSAPFAELAQIQGVSGINVGGYSEQFDNLVDYVVTAKSDIAEAKSYTVNVGETVTLPITVTGVDNFAGMKGVVAYDDSLLSLESISPAAGFILQSSGSTFLVSTSDGMNVSGNNTVVGYAVFKAKANITDDVDTLVSFPSNQITAYDEAFAPISPTVSPLVVTILTEAPLRGDVNLDGKVDLADAILLLQYLSKNVELGSRQLRAADVTGDGSINTADVIVIMQMCL